MLNSEKTRENRVRRRAARLGYQVMKSRLRGWPTLDNHGDYMLRDPRTGIPVMGSYYDASLDDIEAWLTDS